MTIKLTPKKPTEPGLYITSVTPCCRFQIETADVFTGVDGDLWVSTLDKCAMLETVRDYLWSERIEVEIER